MVKQFLYVFLWMGCYCSAQVACPKITSPLDGDVDVPVDAQVSWSPVSGIDGFSVSVGTSPGDSDILNSRSAALVNFLVPVAGLPDDTEIFITISMFINGQFITCPSESFRTVDVTEPPLCTNLSFPAEGTSEVKLGENITWDYAPMATGYLLTIGSSPGGSDILPETDMGNKFSYDPPENLPPSSNVYVKIVPYNENGNADNCREQVFITGNLSIDCNQFNPVLTLPETIGLCLNESEVVVVSEDIADGFRWYQVNDSGADERLLSETNTVTITETGRYRYEAYENVRILGDEAECTSSLLFTVVSSEAADIRNVVIERVSDELELTVQVAGEGDYEYALDDVDGPFQSSKVFSSVSDEDHKIYVRDKNGCGISTYSLIQNLSKDNFPNFFTPNGDDTNDYWQFEPVEENRSSLFETYIFDRYGTLLQVLIPESRGWDGTFQGRPMPSGSYWYRAVAVNGSEIRGYFALKR